MDIRIDVYPQRVRGDQGVENVDVAWFMFSNLSRGPGRGT